MTLIRWKPVREISRWSPVTDLANEFLNMQTEIDRMFDRTRMDTPDDCRASGLTPSVDIIENDQDYTLDLELPGVDKKDVKITITDGTLVISGEKKQIHEGKTDKYRRVERSFGSFERSFTLPATVSSEKIEAGYTNGILTITIPKAEEAKPRKIDVPVK